MLFTVVVSLSVLTGAALAGNDDVLSEEFCRQFPSLHLCRLHDTLQGSLVELQYLLHDTEAQTVKLHPDEVSAMAGPMEKRKSAFVRFGKRSAPEESMEMEKRKSAFVRFGRSLGEADKRKSQYIRFGRK